MAYDEGPGVLAALDVAGSVVVDSFTAHGARPPESAPVLFVAAVASGGEQRVTGSLGASPPLSHGSGGLVVAFELAAGALGSDFGRPCSEALESAYLVAFDPDGTAGAVGGRQTALGFYLAEEHLRDFAVAAAWPYALPCKINETPRELV
jgi:hypothetical protein